MEQIDQTKSNKSKQTSEQFLQTLLELNIEAKVEEMAALFFSINEIALFIDRDEEELREEIVFNTISPLSIAYRRGKLRTKIKLRHDTLNFALMGSPIAVDDMKKYLTEQTINEQDA